MMTDVVTGSQARAAEHTALAADVEPAARSKQQPKPVEGAFYLAILVTETAWIGAIAYLLMRMI
jgi:hypothetical protein